MKRLTFSCALVGFLALAPINGLGQDRDEGIKWFLDTSFTVPVSIALNSNVDAGTRKVYVLLKAQDFKEDILRNIFSVLASRYKENLRITAFSEISHIEKQIEADQPRGCLMFAPTAEGQKAMEQFYKSIYPPSTGYFRAIYFRYPHEEEFYYSPSPDRETMAKVDMRQR